MQKCNNADCRFAASGDSKLRSCDLLQLFIVSRPMVFTAAISHFAVARPVLLPLDALQFAVVRTMLFLPAT